MYPAKKRTGLVAAVTVTVMVLGTIGLTGFVAPGFFLSDDRTFGIDFETGAPKADPDIDAFAHDLVAAVDGDEFCLRSVVSPDDAINKGDQATAESLLCHGMGTSPEQLATLMAGEPRLRTVPGTVETGAGSLSMQTAGTVDGRDIPGIITVFEEPPIYDTPTVRL